MHDGRLLRALSDAETLKFASTSATAEFSIGLQAVGMYISAGKV
jgi:hypothetical protein